MGVRVVFGALLCLLIFLDASVRGSELKLDQRALSISDMPPCGIQCLFLTVPSSSCSFEDIDCQCTNENLAHALSTCMLTNCTMAETLDTAKVQADICNFSNDSKTHEVYLYTGIVFSIAVIFVALRIAGKVLAKRVTPDDWIIIVAMLLTAIPCGCVFAMAGTGFGNHLWDLEHGQLRQCLQFFYISWSTYVIVLGLIKISLIMFYLQIFVERKFRIACYIILAYIAISTLAIFLATIFSCLPVKAFWNRDINGRCLDINALAYANSGSAIAQDIIILILPLSVIRKLQMKRYRKIAVGLMFSVGTFGCITTIIRLRSLLTFKISIDPTWDYVPVTVWTELELGCGFVCVSLPSIRVLLNMILPKSYLSFFASITNRSRGRTDPTPVEELNQPGRQQRKDSSFHQISTSHRGSSRRGSGGSSWWPRWRSTYNEGSQRLESRVDDYPEEQTGGRSAFTVVSPTGQREGWGLLKFPKPSKQFCPSCGSDEEHITALPRIGCLPDRTYSREEVAVEYKV